MDQYAEEKYWEGRYNGVKEFFDWYQRWICVREILTATVLRKGDLILNAGCGVSRLSEEMYDDGYERVISCDISPAAVKLMNDKCKHKKEDFKYEVADIKALPYEEGKFDVVLDKATIDCFFGGADSMDTVHKILKEYYRVLKPKGTCILISYGVPEKRLTNFQHPDFNWQVRIEKVMKLRQINIEEEKDGDAGPEPEYHYIYILVKNDAEPPVIVEETSQPGVAPGDKGKTGAVPAPKKK